MLSKKAKQFLFPVVTKTLAIRMVVVAILAYIIFAHVCVPMRIAGESMAPTYESDQVVFCWKPSYWFSEPDRFDVVFVKMAGNRIVLLKRVVALSGERVAVQNGKLVVNGKPISEPYVAYRGEWNLPERSVRSGFVYLVGDNRSRSMASHVFGQASVDRILGRALSW